VVFGFFPGLFTGMPIPFTGRYMVAGKSPLTGTWGDSNAGGYFGPEIKKCGYDGILIQGKADTPVYIMIKNDEKEILDATKFWGLDCLETEQKLKTLHGNVRVACIGPAGEHLSLVSAIINDLGRAAGRSGFGAVMGSKNLKALVLKGTNKIPIARENELKSLVRKYYESFNAIRNESRIRTWTEFGTTPDIVSSGKSGDSPVKNWGGNPEEHFPIERLEKISAEKIHEYKVRDFGCFTCPLQCGAILKVEELGIKEMHLPEYETCSAFGSLLLNDDLMSLFKINDICNRGGIDTISAGGIIAFAMECYEKGILSKENTGGLDLTWGNSKAIIELLDKIIAREGIGDLLADGAKRASEKIGKNSKKFAIHSLGQELPMHDPKIYASLGMTYSFDPTPGRHTAASLDWYLTSPIKDGKIYEGFTLPKGFEKIGSDNRHEAMKRIACLTQATSSLGICWFSWSIQPYPLIKFLNSLTGWDITMEELLKSGMRIQTLRQAFTLREGINIMENKLPGRTVGDPPFKRGPWRGITIDYIGDYKGYCKKMGWDPVTGYPLKKTLKELNLEFIIDELY
ncbi:MAG: aldehyde ferredoxin oxidoreductase family protein, partial [Promethearchaeota archaeon]